MPEYLAPGVYVEETSFRSKSIEGVSTTTTGFVGPCRYGPVTLEPDILTSLLDFERVYGDRQQLDFGGEQHNYLWHAVRAFFEEGGKRLYFARAFRPLDPIAPEGYRPPEATLAGDNAPLIGERYRTDGHARRWLTEQTAAVGAAVRSVREVAATAAAAAEPAARADALALVAAKTEVDVNATAQEKTQSADAVRKVLKDAGEAVAAVNVALTSAQLAVANAKAKFAASTMDTTASLAASNATKLAADEALKPVISEAVLADAALAAQQAAGDAEAQRGKTILKTDAAAALPGLSAELAARTKKVADQLKDAGEVGKAVKALKDAADAAKGKADAAKANPAKRPQADTAISDLWTKAAAAGSAIDVALMDAQRAKAQADLEAVALAVLTPITDALDELQKLAEAVKAAVNEALAAHVPLRFATSDFAEKLATLRTALDSVLDAGAATAVDAAVAASAAPHKNAVLLRARFPGDAGNVSVRFVLQLGQNALAPVEERKVVRGLQPGDVVWIGGLQAGADGQFLIAGKNDAETDWFFSTDGTAAKTEFWLNQPQPPAPAKPRLNIATDHVRIVTLGVEVTYKDGTTHVWTGLALQPGHRRNGGDDSLTGKFSVQPVSGLDARQLPMVVLLDNSVTHALSLYQTLFNATDAKFRLPASPLIVEVEHVLSGGNDGQRPIADDYRGAETDHYKTGLRAFEDLEDISIVAAPGSTAGLENGYSIDARQITNLLIAHAKTMRYRIAVLDSGDGQSIGQVRAHRGRIDSEYAALYYPWVKVLDPVTRREINLPPSGFVTGIYARNDIQRAVWKAPANEVVNGAIGFEQTLNKAQQEVLNPEGINCFRFFEGRGYRLWGARTISSDPEWKYVNVRRYFAYLERSIDKGTQWAVFEPNGEALWANVRRTIEDFLLNEWQSGALLGEKPEKAFFVKCDRSTMSQNDLDNGRLICLIGVAPLKPAEFVIFRIGQWTADRKV